MEAQAEDEWAHKEKPSPIRGGWDPRLLQALYIVLVMLLVVAFAYVVYGGARIASAALYKRPQGWL